jgi:hypothetical protein
MPFHVPASIRLLGSLASCIGPTSTLSFLFSWTQLTDVGSMCLRPRSCQPQSGQPCLRRGNQQQPRPRRPLSPVRTDPRSRGSSRRRLRLKADSPLHQWPSRTGWLPTWVSNWCWDSESMTAERLAVSGCCPTATRMLSYWSHATRTTATVNARMRVRAQPPCGARRTKDRMSFYLRTSAGCFGGDWALRITFAASGHQRTSEGARHHPLRRRR